MASNSTSLTSSATDSASIIKTRLLAIAAGLVANVVFFLLVTQVAGHEILVPMTDPPEPLPIGPVIGASVFPALVGLGLLLLLEKITPDKAAVIWGVIAVVVLIGGMPFAAPVSGTDKLLLGIMHLIVGLAVIPTFVITSRRRA